MVDDLNLYVIFFRSDIGVDIMKSIGNVERIIRKSGNLKLFCLIVMLIIFILSQSEAVYSLSIGLSPPKLNLTDDKHNVFFVFNPNNFSVITKFYTKNYILEPDTLILSKNSYSRVLVEPKVCANENITVLVVSNSSLLPGLKLKVFCSPDNNANSNNLSFTLENDSNTNNINNKSSSKESMTLNNKNKTELSEEKVRIFSVSSMKDSSDYKSANPLIGLLIIFFIVVTGLSVFYLGFLKK